jgi:hypothetical protein
LAGKEKVDSEAVSEAIHYRSLDGNWAAIKVRQAVTEIRCVDHFTIHRTYMILFGLLVCTKFVNIIFNINAI